MFVPTHMDSIRISMVKKGCSDIKFDLIYPLQLNGIIDQNEYQQSITRINTILEMKSCKTYTHMVCFLMMIIGIVMMIVGMISPNPPLSGYGLFLFLLSVIAYIYIKCLRRGIPVGSLKEAIARESEIYSRRSPTPCIWRLETDVRHFGITTETIYQIVIDIVRFSTPVYGASYSNQNATESSYLINERNNLLRPSYVNPPPSNANPSEPYDDLPPPYIDPSVKICSQCGKTEHKQSARFCSSCGYSLII